MMDVTVQWKGQYDEETYRPTSKTDLYAVRNALQGLGFNPRIVRDSDNAQTD